MHLIAATIGCGPHYYPLAERAAASVRKHTGLETHILTDAGDGHPKCLKFTLLDRFPGQAVLYVDADTYMVRDWDPRPLAADGRLCAVRDWPTPGRDADCRRYQIDPGRYFNSGVMILTPDHTALARRAAEIQARPDYHSDVGVDQTAWNAAAAELQTPVNLLPSRCNAYTVRPHFPADAIVLHAGGGIGSDNRRWFEHVIQTFKTAPPHAVYLAQLLATGATRPPRIGAEVGVYRGDTSRALLAMFPAMHLHAVDLWSPAPYANERNRFQVLAHQSPAAWADNERAARAALAPYATRCTIHKTDLDTAAQSIAPGSLDWVFLDATHAYEDTRAAIAAWCPTVCPGGLVAGHDYGEPRPGFEGVGRAVDEAATYYDVLLHTHPATRVWWFLKP